MSVGDVLTKTGGGSPPAWADAATVIGADGPVLTNHTGVPSWTTASAAVAGGWSVLTVYDDLTLSHNRPAWLPLSAPPSTVVWVLNSNGTISVFGTDKTALGTFSYTHSVGSIPSAIAVVGSEVWVADYEFGHVTRFDFNGNQLGDYSLSAGSIANPTGIAVFGSQAWITDVVAPAIGRFKFDGTVAASTIFSYPLGDPEKICIVDGSAAWVANGANAFYRVTRTAFAGTYLEPNGLTGNGLNQPFSIAYDGTHIWVGNDGNNSISRFNPNGTAYGSPITTGIDLDHPRGAAYINGLIWFANYGIAYGSYHLSLFNPSGTVATGSPITGNGLSQSVDLCEVPLGSSPIW